MAVLYMKVYSHRNACSKQQKYDKAPKNAKIAMTTMLKKDRK